MKAIHYFQVESDPFEDIDTLKKELLKYQKFKFLDYFPRDEQRKYLLKYGITNTINPKYSEFFGTPRDDRDLFINVLQNFLDNVITANSLVIVDSYIFPKNYDDEYSDLLVDILKKYIPKLNSLMFITKNNFHRPLQLDIFNKIKELKNHIVLDLRHSELFHDRFWLSDKSNQGIFMGTSLNGLGKKFTLIDYINSEDVSLIFQELQAENLLS
ncbi:hypothetical protein [Flavivirga rizhaonensis]|uniref:Uncharacterized protein n=1 Tax=Flavivirga rizhaonensis TaxID=2559571 RepID=A0A4V3P4F2_9FLAO|nr:hypothetical protein [Flavivirga rizhaonensis]TGV01234.1 hypothetical protein EM932_16480 [Flavivirga rizhaonensis]